MSLSSKCPSMKYTIINIYLEAGRETGARSTTLFILLNISIFTWLENMPHYAGQDDESSPPFYWKL